MTIAERLIAYMALKGYDIDRLPGQFNIVYVEGCDPNGKANADRLDEWNDMRYVVEFDASGVPQLVHSGIATTEPGRLATFDASAARRGGVARVPFGQFRVWQLGFHKKGVLRESHPALVQVLPFNVYRDALKRGIRQGALLPAWGINQHSTRLQYKGGPVANWSEGCLVEKDFESHLRFISLCKADIRYQADKDYIFASTIIAGDDLEKNFPFALAA